MKKITPLIIIAHLLTSGLYMYAADTEPTQAPTVWESIEIDNKAYVMSNISKDTLIDNQHYEINVLIANHTSFYIRTPLNAPNANAGEFEFEFCNREGSLVDQKPGFTAVGIEIIESDDQNLKHTLHFISREKAIALLITVGASTGMAVAATYAADWYNKEIAPKKEWSKIDRRHAAAIAWIATAIACSSYFYCTTTAESHIVV